MCTRCARDVHAMCARCARDVHPRHWLVDEWVADLVARHFAALHPQPHPSIVQVASSSSSSWETREHGLVDKFTGIIHNLQVEIAKQNVIIAQLQQKLAASKSFRTLEDTIVLTKRKRDVHEG